MCMILITIVNGVYKPTNITGGPHIGFGYGSLGPDGRSILDFTPQGGGLFLQPDTPWQFI